MSIKVLIVLLAVAAVSYAASTDDGGNSGGNDNGGNDGGGNAFENIDIEDLKANPERIDDLLDCFTTDAMCNENDAAIKERASQIESTGCEPCSEKEKNKLKKLFDIVFIKRPRSVSKCIDFFNHSGHLFKIIQEPVSENKLITKIQDEILKFIPEIMNQATDILTSDNVANLIDSAQDLVTGLRGKKQSKT